MSLDVRGKRTLEESLNFYVQGELMEGDNQYFCEDAQQKVCPFCQLLCYERCLNSALSIRRS